jgi:hypothetical protein
LTFDFRDNVPDRLDLNGLHKLNIMRCRGKLESRA